MDRKENVAGSPISPTVDGETKTPAEESITRPKPLKEIVLGSEEYGSFEAPNFDEVFANTGHYRPKLKQLEKYKESTDEGISSSFDTEIPEDDIGTAETDPDPESTARKVASGSKVSRGDSIMEKTFKQILVKGFENSGGFYGFRRRVANDINHKYCFVCGFDDILFVFLHVVFGIVCIIAGVFGIMECSGLKITNSFIFVEGVLSVFVFPILLMNWTKQIGGCVHEDQKMGRGIFFIFVLILRIMTAVAGTVLLLLNLDWLTYLHIEMEEKWCQLVVYTFLTSVAFGWTFLILIILLPFCWYGLMYLVAKILRMYKREEDVNKYRLSGVVLTSIQRPTTRHHNVDKVV